jgi:hypothetical protein
LTEELAMKIAAMEDKDALAALEELRLRRRYTFRKTDTQLMASVQIGPADHILSLQALIDSGCEGSCINWRTIKDNSIPTRKFPIPILIYNADGRPNAHKNNHVLCHDQDAS